VVLIRSKIVGFKSALITGLVIIPFLIIGIAAGIEYDLYRGSATVQSENPYSVTISSSSITAGVSESGIGQGYGGSTSSERILITGQLQDTQFYFYIVAAFLGLTASIYLTRRKKTHGREAHQHRIEESSERTMLAVAVLFLATVAFAIWSISNASLLSFGELSIPTTLSNKLERFSILLIIVVSLAFLVFLSLFALNRRRRKDGGDLQSKEKLTEDLKQIVDRAIRVFQEGEGGYKEAIIECYKQMLLLFEGRGLPQRVTLTPREFQKDVENRLGKPLPHLQELTYLFERARYSNEEMESWELETAKHDLIRISGYLEEQIKQTPIPTSKM
jgi:hypothetical protein